MTAEESSLVIYTWGEKVDVTCVCVRQTASTG